MRSSRRLPRERNRKHKRRRNTLVLALGMRQVVPFLRVLGRRPCLTPCWRRCRENPARRSFLFFTFLPLWRRRDPILTFFPITLRRNPEGVIVAISWWPLFRCRPVPVPRRYRCRPLRVCPCRRRVRGGWIRPHRRHIARYRTPLFPTKLLILLSIVTNRTLPFCWLTRPRGPVRFILRRMALRFTIRRW